MPKAYSRDLRERVITAVETGASRREAAERFEVSVTSAVKWLQRWYQQRSAAPQPRGGSISPLEEFSGEILDLIARQPDLTLVETVAELRKRRIKTSRAIEKAGATLRYLPKYSPDLNPIEMPYSKFKTFLRKVAARTVPGLNRAIRSFIPQLSPQECANYFRHAGYASI